MGDAKIGAKLVSPSHTDSDLAKKKNGAADDRVGGALQSNTICLISEKIMV